MNLHHDGPTRVAVSVKAAAGADVTVSRELESDRLDGSPPAAIQDGAPFDLETLGWSEAVVRFRPVLTYGELARMSSEKPSALFDPLNRILGLEDLTAADALLRAVDNRLSQHGKDARTRRPALLEALAASGDDRSEPLRRALAGKSPDIDRASELLDGDVPGAVGGERSLATWAALAAPDSQAARAAAELLTAAADRRDEVAMTAAGRADQLAARADTDPGTHIDPATRTDLATRTDPAGQAAEATAAISEVFGRLGFDPEAHDDTIRLRSCPFRETASRYPEIVCQVHTGLAQRLAERAFDGERVQVRLTPFVEPELCVLRLAPRTDGALVR